MKGIQSADERLQRMAVLLLTGRIDILQASLFFSMSSYWHVVSQQSLELFCQKMALPRLILIIKLASISFNRKHDITSQTYGGRTVSFWNYEYQIIQIQI